MPLVRLPLILKCQQVQGAEPLGLWQMSKWRVAGHIGCGGGGEKEASLSWSLLSSSPTAELAEGAKPRSTQSGVKKKVNPGVQKLVGTTPGLFPPLPLHVTYPLRQSSCLRTVLPQPQVNLFLLCPPKGSCNLAENETFVGSLFMQLVIISF